MYWVALIGSLYILGVIPTFIASAKYKKKIKSEWCSWQIFTFAWPLVAFCALIFVLLDLPGRFSKGLDRLHNQFSRWLNTPKTKVPSCQEDLLPFVGGYRDAAGAKCPACHRNV